LISRAMVTAGNRGDALDLIRESSAAPTITVKQREATHVGSRYEGSVSISTGRREGKGMYVYPNSFFTYEGDWLDGKKHGRGRLSFGDGGYYEGDFVQGEIVGQGSQTWKDDTVYTGQFVAGERHGFGRISLGDGSSYDGAWEWNKYSGQGELTTANGDCYIGAFKGHKYHGKGVLTQPSTDRRYEGQFEAGLFKGEGELKEGGDAFVYVGQFEANKMCGQGKGIDTPSGIAYVGTWDANEPTGRSEAWDLATVPSHERANESLLLFSEGMREEASDQQGPAAADPKAKAKPKAKGKAKAEEEVEEDRGPELQLMAGEPFPEVVLRLVDSEKKPFPSESGRRWKVTMFRERKVPNEEDPAEMDILRREVRFGDLRVEYVDPLDAEAAPPKAPSPEPKGKAAPKKGGKAVAETPEPPPVEEEDAEPEPEIYSGESSMDGTIGEEGEVIIGNNEAWKLPVHLLPMIYWLRIEDTTEGVSGESFCQLLPVLEFPVRVKVPE